MTSEQEADGRELNPWFALQVRPRHEKNVSEILRNKGFEEYLPLYSATRRWSDRKAQVSLPLFPGYLFCRMDWRQRVLPILTTPGVQRVLGIGDNPIPVDETELDSIRTALKSGLTVQPWTAPLLGETVYIERGPLEGLEGVLVGIKNRTRLILSVTMLQRSVAVEVEADWARPTSKRVRPATNHNRPQPISFATGVRPF
jgi:transcription antitermination factor NusG